MYSFAEKRTEDWMINGFKHLKRKKREKRAERSEIIVPRTDSQPASSPASTRIHDRNNPTTTSEKVRQGRKRG
jgi:hypothetical protein